MCFKKGKNEQLMANFSVTWKTLLCRFFPSICCITNGGPSTSSGERHVSKLFEHQQSRNLVDRIFIFNYIIASIIFLSMYSGTFH